jgi:TetR/AcrR family transcriptional repressor of lmrAB and yxaGH operons
MMAVISAAASVQYDDRHSQEEPRVTNDSRASMVRSAAALISSRGVSATSFADVVGDSGAPRGSIYHHFPDGKRQLAEDAIRWTSERVLAYLRSGSTESAEQVLGRFIDLWRQVVVASSGSAGCVVAGVAVDTVDDARMLELVRATFQSWVDLLAQQLSATGMAADRARPIAQITLAGMEGALILCRAEGGVGPLDVVADELLRLVLAEATSAA